MKRKHYGSPGGGRRALAGIRSALDLAESGHKVALIDRRPRNRRHPDPARPPVSLSDHCGMCKHAPAHQSRDSSSQFCHAQGPVPQKHRYPHRPPNWTGARRRPRQVQGLAQAQRSTLRGSGTSASAAAKCAKVCPVHVPSEFNAGLTERTRGHPSARAPRHPQPLRRWTWNSCTRCREVLRGLPHRGRGLHGRPASRTSTCWPPMGDPEAGADGRDLVRQDQNFAAARGGRIRTTTPVALLASERRRCACMLLDLSTPDDMDAREGS